MRILLLGATGGTGLALTEQALAKDHSVTALVRSPDKMKSLDSNEKLKVVKGDIFDVDTLVEHMKETDVVMSTLGFSALSRPVTGYYRVTESLLEATRRDASVCRRLILMHAWMTEPESRKQAQGFFVRWVLLPMINPILDNMHEAEKLLAKEDVDVDFTVVLPAGLTNKSVTSSPFRTVENAYLIDGAEQRIARADVARFMLEEAEKKAFSKKIVAIAI